MIEHAEDFSGGFFLYPKQHTLPHSHSIHIVSTDIKRSLDNDDNLCIKKRSEHASEALIL